MKVSMVIPAYYINEDFVKMTANCLNSMGNEKPDEIIVVDDHSPIEYEFDGVINIRRAKNGRFPKAVNTGLRASTGDIIIVCNNDITFYPGWLKGLRKVLKTCDIGSIRVTDETGWETHDVVTTGDYFGSIWAMKRHVYETLGGLDTDFTLGAFEDKDYYNRARKAGFTIGKYHGALVEHIGRATNSVEFPNHEDFESSKEVYRNKYGRVD